MAVSGLTQQLLIMINIMIITMIMIMIMIIIIIPSLWFCGWAPLSKLHQNPHSSTALHHHPTAFVSNIMRRRENKLNFELLTS